MGLIELGVVVGIRLVYFVDSLYIFLVLKYNLLLLKEFISMLKVFFEFMSFVDFVIWGLDRVFLVKLKRVIGGEEVFGIRDGDGDVKFVRYVVDILIVKMGGVDGLDKVGGVFIFRMMFSVGVVVVVGEFFLWILCEDDDKIIVLFRIRMVKVLLLIL